MACPTSTLFSQNEKLLSKSRLFRSNSVAASETTILADAAITLTNAKVFHISTLGVPLLGNRCTSSQLITNVFAADNIIAYTSNRGKHTSGNCTLSTPLTGDLITTTYRFGPGKPPTLRYVDTPKGAENEEVTLHGQWLSRTQGFVAPSGHSLEWRYTCELTPETGKKMSILVLLDLSEGRRIAQLVRTEGTRTEGSSRYSAGNGGLLLVDEEACEKVADEVLVIASCLVMLKKEIDRRRCMRALVLSAAISAGGSC
jgi:hypothetical protein